MLFILEGWKLQEYFGEEERMEERFRKLTICLVWKVCGNMGCPSGWLLLWMSLRFEYHY